VSVSSGGSNYLGFKKYDPETTVLPSSSVFSFSSISGTRPTGVRIPGTGISVIGLQGTTHSLLLTLTNTFAAVNKVQQLYPTGRFRVLD
jgi:hypothetical protein